MTSLDGLARQLALIRKSVAPAEPENYLDSPEYPQLLAVMRRVLPAYPEAQRATERAIVSMVAPMSEAQVHEVLYGAIEPYMDARVAVAAALMELVKPGSTP